MSTDPSAADLAAVRARLLAKCPRTDEPEDLAYLGVWSEDLRAFVAAYDAQAARLVAVDTLLHTWIAECCGAQAGQRFCESFGCGSLLEILDALHGASGAVGTGEARDGE